MTKRHSGLLFVATDEQRAVVTALADGGLSQEEIARRVIDSLTDQSISLKTLRKHFAKELREGKAGANAAVRTCLFKMATDGKNVAATIFWAKTQMGYKEPAQALDITHTYGELVEAAARVKPSASPPELKVVDGGKAA